MNGFSVEIEWDPRKAAANVRKHGISFTVAATVLRDQLSVTTFDEAHSDIEEPWITVGMAVNESTPKARIISAREAENSERREYEQGL